MFPEKKSIWITSQSSKRELKIWNLHHTTSKFINRNTSGSNFKWSYATCSTQVRRKLPASVEPRGDRFVLKEHVVSAERSGVQCGLLFLAENLIKSSTSKVNCKNRWPCALVCSAFCISINIIRFLEINFSCKFAHWPGK